MQILFVIHWVFVERQKRSSNVIIFLTFLKEQMAKYDEVGFTYLLKKFFLFVMKNLKF